MTTTTVAPASAVSISGPLALSQHPNLMLVAAYQQAVNDAWGNWFLFQSGGDDDAVVRRWTANHPDAAGMGLIHLLTDPDWTVRLAAVNHPNLPEHLLADLTYDPEPLVRAAVATRTRSAAVLNTMLGDGSPEVLDAVVANPMKSSTRDDIAVRRAKRARRRAAAAAAA